MARKQADIQWFVFLAADAVGPDRNKLNIREMNNTCKSAAFKWNKVHWKSVSKPTEHTGNYRPNFLRFNPHVQQRSIDP